MHSAFSKVQDTFTRAPLHGSDYHLYLYNPTLDIRKLGFCCCCDQDSVLKHNTLRRSKTSPKLKRVGIQLCNGKIKVIPALFLKSVVSCCQGIPLRFPFLCVAVSQHSLILYIIYHYQHRELHQRYIVCFGWKLSLLPLTMPIVLHSQCSALAFGGLKQHSQLQWERVLNKY